MLLEVKQRIEPFNIYRRCVSSLPGIVWHVDSAASLPCMWASFLWKVLLKELYYSKIWTRKRSMFSKFEIYEQLMWDSELNF